MIVLTWNGLSNIFSLYLHVFFYEKFTQIKLGDQKITPYPFMTLNDRNGKNIYLPIINKVEHIQTWKLQTEFWWILANLTIEIID